METTIDVDYSQSIIEAIQSDLELQQLKAAKANVYATAIPTIRHINNGVVYVWSDEVNEIIKGYDEIIELRTQQITDRIKRGYYANYKRP